MQKAPMPLRQSSRTVGASAHVTSEAAGAGQAPAANATPGSAADAAAVTGVALPAGQPATFVADPDATSDESAGGLTSGIDGVSAVPGNGGKGSMPGTSSAGAKLKSVNADTALTALSAAAPLHKPGEAAQVVDPVSGGANANANVSADAATAPAGVHGGTTGAAATQTDAKAAQSGSGETGTDGAGKASTSNVAQSWDAATQVVHRAQLIQAMHQSEMRMGMNSAEFGNISISAAVSHQMLSAQISLEHAGLSHALTAQLPEIEKNLGSAYGLQSRVEVRDGSSSAQHGSSRGDANGAPAGGGARSNASQSGPALPAAALESVSTANYSPAAGMRLDILI